MKKKMKTLLRRLRNKRVIVAIVSGIVLILTNTGVIDVTKANHINAVLDSVLTVVIGLGIVSDPDSHVKE